MEILPRGPVTVDLNGGPVESAYAVVVPRKPE